jgi:hypothetical protein
MIEYYRKKLLLLENLLDRDWLANKSGKSNSRPKPPRHPAQKLWTAAQQALTDAEGGRLLNPAELDTLADLDELAETLVAASRLGGFRDLMLPKLTDKKCAPHFPSYVYEARIGVLHAKTGQAVKFIPPVDDKKGIQSPDIEVSWEGANVHVECKRRERIPPVRFSQEKEDQVAEQMRAIMDEVKRNFDFMLFLHGAPDAEALRVGLTGVKELASLGGCGIRSNPDAGVWFLVRDRPAPPAGWVKGVYNLPYDAPNAPSSYFLGMHVQRNEQDLVQVADWKTGYLFNFSSHAFKQVTYSLDQGRKQLAGDEAGAIYIDLDPAGMNGPTLEWYVGLMNRALADLAWRGGQNRRVGVIALTSGPIRQEVLINGGKARVNIHFFFCRMAPHLTGGGSSIYTVFNHAKKQREKSNAE